MGENSRDFKCGYIPLNKGKVVCIEAFGVIPFKERIMNLLGLCVSLPITIV